MKRVTELESDCLDEMAIVDLFTRLIFDAESKLDESAQLAVDLLMLFDNSLRDASRRELSEYLRSMGVTEMIEVVAELKLRLDHPHCSPVSSSFSSRIYS